MRLMLKFGKLIFHYFVIFRVFIIHQNWWASKRMTDSDYDYWLLTITYTLCMFHFCFPGKIILIKYAFDNKFVMIFSIIFLLCGIFRRFPHHRIRSGAHRQHLQTCRILFAYMFECECECTKCNKMRKWKQSEFHSKN